VQAGLRIEHLAGTGKRLDDVVMRLVRQHLADKEPIVPAAQARRFEAIHDTLVGGRVEVRSVDN
jgi:hypothetical protein